MRNKKLIVIAAVVALALVITGVILFLLPEKACEHSGGTATCTKLAVCSACGQEYGELKPHDYEAATCTEAKHCKNCSAVEGEALGHTGGEASCVAKAQCSRCGEEYGSLAAHAYTQQKVLAEALKSEATCTSPAIYYKSCACGLVSDVDTFAFGEALPHTFNNEDVKAEALKSEATCTSPALYYKSCSCGAISSSNLNLFTYGDVGAHVYNQTSVKTEALKSEASCTSPALYYKSCACGAVSTDDADVFNSGDTLEHTYVEVESVDASCEGEATKTYRCSCGDEYTETVGLALGHDISGVVGVEQKVEGSTCQYVLVYTCKTCNKDVEGDTVDRHTYVASITKEATCAEDGLKSYACSKCGLQGADELIPKSESKHVWVKGVATLGTRTDTCSVCRATKTVTVYEGTQTNATNTNDLKDKEIELNDANISLGNGVIDAIGNKDITISADKLADEDKTGLGLTEDQLAQVGDNPIYNFTINDGTSNISDFGAGNYVTITLPYTLSEGEDVDSIAVWYIDDNGQLSVIEATYSNGYITFQTDHFSYYTVTKLTPAERCAKYGHSYTEKVQEATCTKDGYVLYFCVRCHDQYKVEGEAAYGHSFTETRNDPTCQKVGYITYKCDECNYSYKTRLSKLDHDYAVVEHVDSTCTAAGYTVYACRFDGCNRTYTEYDAIPPHDYEITVVAPTCETEGYTFYECKNCEHSYEDSYLAALGHDYKVDNWSWADDYSSARLTVVCTNDASHKTTLDANISASITRSPCSEYYIKTVYTATVSYGGQVFEDTKTTEIGTASHVFGAEWKFNDDEHWHECACGERSDVTKHSFENDTFTKAPTCEENGESTAYCSCGAIYITEIEALGHDFTESERVEPSCTVEGYIKYVCSRCADEYTEALHLAEHVIVDTVVSPTCTENGYTLHECSNCDYSYTDTEVEALGHSEVIDAAVAPTCTEAGLTEGKHCSVCGVILEAQQEVSPLGHDMVVDAAVSPTCTVAGLTEGSHCSRCDEMTVAQEVVAALGHDILVDAAVAPTCTATGLTEGSHCSRCDEMTVAQEAIAALGHDIVVDTAVVPTCTEAGLTEGSHCSRCDGATVAQQVIPALGHTESDWIIDKEETMTEEGSKHTVCTVCGETLKTETIPVYVGLEFALNEDGTSYYVKGIGNYASLDIVIPAEYKGLPVVAIGADAFANNKEITSVTIPSSVTVIGENAFKNCDGIVEITLPEGLVTISDNAFFACKELKGVTIPNSVTSIGKMAFSNCGALEYIHYIGTELEWEAVEKGKDWNKGAGKHVITFEFEVVEPHEHEFVDGVCTICGIAENECDHSFTKTETIDFADHGACGMVIEYMTCECGAVKRILDGDDGACNFESASYEEIVDENGEIIGVIMEGVCTECGLYIYVNASLTVEGCLETYRYDIIFSMGETVLLDNITYIHEYYDHEIEIVTIDLSSKYEGCCGGIMTLEVCADCGMISSVESFLPDCEVFKGDEPDPEEIVDENGIKHYVYTIQCPDCGLKAVVDGWEEVYSVCESAEFIKVVGYYGDEVIVETFDSYGSSEHKWEYTYELKGESCEDGVVVTSYCPKCNTTDTYTSYYHRDYKYFMVDLSEHTECGAAIYAYGCGICNYVQRVYNTYFGCEFGETVKEELFDENNVSIGYRTTATCKHCGLTIVQENTTKYDSACTYTEYRKYQIFVGEECIFENENSSYYGGHEYVYSYEFPEGATCENGSYIVNVTCANCDYSNSYTDNGHYYTYYNINLADYGNCDGYINVYGCRACGWVESINDHNFGCRFGISVTEDVLNEAGEVVGYLKTYTCSECGLVVTNKQYSEYISACEFYQHSEQTFTLADGTVLTRSRTSNYGSHNYEYTYDLPEGATCSDGYDVTQTCTKCGYTNTYHTTEHSTEVAYIYLSEYGACGGYIQVDRCSVCNKITYLYSHSYGSSCSVTETVEEITNEAGEVIGNITTQICSTCGLTIVRNYTYERNNNCSIYYEVYLTISIGGEEIVSSNRDEYYGSAHEYEYVYEKAAGTTCADGYIYTYTCKHCGSSYSNYATGHRTERFEINLADHGGCEGYIYGYRCVVCNTITSLDNMDLNCDIEDSEATDEIVDENGITHRVGTATCPTCGLIFVVDTWNETTACTNTYYYLIQIYSGEELIFEYVNKSTSENHKYEYTYELEEGKTCLDGYYVYRTCTECGYSVEWGYYSDHRTGYTEIDLSEYIGCGGYVRVYACEVCGEIVSYYGITLGCESTMTWVEEELADENGEVYRYTRTGTCSVCGIVAEVAQWIEYESECTYYLYTSINILVDSVSVFGYETSEGYNNHEYVYAYDLLGSNCDNGVRVITTCANCDYYYEYTTYGHIQSENYIYLRDYGLCGGYVREYNCAACDDYYYVDTYYHCNWQYVETNADGYDVYHCEYCDGIRCIRTVETEKDENCYFTRTVSEILIINDEEIFRFEEEYEQQGHRYEYEFILDGETCKDGYRVITTCKDCDYRNEGGTNYYHYTYYFKLHLEEYGCCDSHVVYVNRCACGYNMYIEVSGLEWNDELNAYHCDECALTASVVEELIEAEDACTRDFVKRLAVICGETKISGLVFTTSYIDHNYSSLEYTLVDGVITFAVVCDKCGDKKAVEYQQAELVDDGNGSYYYDFTFTPEESAVYVITSMTSGDTYVELYEMVDGELVRITENDDGASNNNFYLAYELNEGTTYVYRIRFLDSSKSGTISYSFGKQVENENDLPCSHYYYNLYVLPNGSSSCEDGVVRAYVCKYCGLINSVSQRYSHDSDTIEYIELSNIGACYGYFSYYSCACGENAGFNWSFCYDSYESNEEYDENGNRIITATYSCSSCGLEIKNVCRVTKDRENCLLIYDYNVEISMNGELVYTRSYQQTEISHDYKISFDMYGETCEDGYREIYTCADCGDSYEGNEYYYHRGYNIYSLDHNAGQYCDSHYVSVYACPCKENNFYYNTNLDWTENGNECSECGLHVYESYDWIEDETCVKYYVRSIVITIGETEIYRDEYIYTYENHSYGDVTVEALDGSYTLTYECSKCKDLKSITSQKAELAEDENGEYYYDFTFTPEESGNYLIQSMTSGDTYVTLYQVVDGEYYRVASNDDGGNNGNFYLRYTLSAESTYVYRIRFYNSSKAGTINFIFDKVTSELSCSHNEKYFTIFKEGSVSCNDGIYCVRICEYCGRFDHSYESTSHETVSYNRVELSQFGACYGYHYFYSCACGQSQGFSQYFCYDAYDYVEEYDENGNLVNIQTYSCSTCGLSYIYRTYSVKNHETCQLVYHYEVTISMNGEVVYTDSYEKAQVNHEYERGFELYGNSCEDGYKEIYTCVDCGDSYDGYEYYYHNTYRVAEFSPTDDNFCSDHYVYVNACPCGREYYYGCNNMDWDSEAQKYVCDECDLTIYSTSEWVDDESCVKNYVETIVITLGEEELYHDSRSVSYENHSYGDVSIEALDGIYTLSYECSKCEDVKTITSQKAELVDDGDGNYYYDFTFTPEETATYYITNWDNGGACVELYRLIDEELNYITWAYWNVGNSQFYLSYDLTAGETYVYRIRFYDSTKSGTINFLFDKMPDELSCNHNYKYFSALKEDSEICGDGALYGRICEDCGRLNYIYELTSHRNITSDYIDLSANGACHGDYYYYSCACGENQGFSIYSCYDSSDRTEEYDENGNLVITETRSCSTCGLSYVRSYYSVKDRESCKMRYYYHVTITIGEEVLLDKDYEVARKHHEYEISFDMLGTSCTEGYKVIYTCVDCGYSFEENGGYIYTSHSSYYTYPLNSLEGEFCEDHSIYYYACPCGYHFGYNVSGFEWYSETQMYGCADCGLNVYYTTEDVDLGCVIDRTKEFTITCDDEELVYYTTTNSYINHNYAEVEYELNDGILTLTYECVKCGDLKTAESQQGTITQDENGSWYYDYEFIPDETGYYQMRYLFNNYGYIYLYKMVDGEMQYIQSGYYGDALTALLEEGETYIYRFSYYSYEYSIDFMITKNVTEYFCNHNSSTGFAYLLEDSEYCTDGSAYGSVCTTCGRVNSIYSSTSHNTVRDDYIDLTQYGACYGYHSFYSCACGYDHGFNRSFCYDYSNTREHYDDDGNLVRTETRTCSQCGLCYVRTYYSVRDRDECKMRYYYTVFISIGDEIIFEEEYEIEKIEHDYRASFDMYGESCYDGYAVVYTCIDCGDSYEGGESYSHNTYNLYVLDAIQLGCCNDHSLTVYGCPCGYNFGYNYSNFEWNDVDQMYSCADCGLGFSWLNYEETGVCTVTSNKSISVTYGDEELYSNEATCVHFNHQFQNVTAEVIDGVYTVNATCSECGETRTFESNEITLEESDGSYYYDYVVTPDETTDYRISVFNENYVYMTLYKVVDGEWSYIIRNSGSNFTRTNLLNEGETYIYRFSYTSEQTINFFFEKYRYFGYECSHNSSTYFSCLKDGAESCTDGTLYGYLCNYCGRLTSAYYNYSHNSILQESVDLSDYGACYGSYRYYSCSCGEEEYVSIDRCGWSSTSNQYYDEEGKLIYVQTRTCSTCGLRDDISYYTVKDRENCTLTYYYTVSITIGETLIAEKSYVRTETSHDYEWSAELDDGATSCEQGVTITYTCKDCGYSYSNYYTYHYTYTKETIDLEQYGAVCKGYATVIGCACGRYNSLSLGNLLCDLGQSSYTYNAVENAIQRGWHYTASGSYHFDNYGYIYTCAVTDPERCAFKIRYTNYWLKDEDSCTAYRYETYQFGYNEETGECLYEITQTTGDIRTYHDYTLTQSNNSTHYDCADCGSYYYEDYYYDNNGYESKYEIISENTLDDGNLKYHQYVIEYDYDDNGSRYQSRIFEKYIYSDSSEWYRERLLTPYTTTFGDYGYEVTSTTHPTDGRVTTEHYAYVYYYGYEYRIFTEHTEGNYWYRYDYSYEFITDVGCFRTQTYTDSTGANEVTEGERYCRNNYHITLLTPTCTQNGEYCYECAACGSYSDSYVSNPYGHNWRRIVDGWYYCARCGLENANGADGSIVMADLTEEYGNGENYVVGYWNKNNVYFTKYVSILLEDGTELILEGIEYSEIEELRAVVFSKADVEAAATELGYSADEYLVRFVFVPYGADSSFDYAITFTTPNDYNGGVITDDVLFVQYVGVGERVSFTVTPEEDSVWAFTSMSDYDTYGYLYDADGNLLVYNDDGGANNNFYFTYTLEAGESYTFTVRWYHGDREGDMKLYAICNPVSAE